MVKPDGRGMTCGLPCAAFRVGAVEAAAAGVPDLFRMGPRAAAEGAEKLIEAAYPSLTGCCVVAINQDYATMEFVITVAHQKLPRSYGGGVAEIDSRDGFKLLAKRGKLPKVG